VERGGRCELKHLLLLFFLLPTLLLAPSLGGAVAWFHAHGPSGGHLHLLPSKSAVEGLHGLQARLEARHEHADEDVTHEEEDHPPHGLRIELPRILAASPRGTALAAAASLLAPAPLCGIREHAALAAGRSRPRAGRAHRPLVRARRSGVAELLRSSHALLI